MKNYQTLFFDVDDTLLDFGAAERVALEKLFMERGITLTAEIEAKYKTINQGLWNAFEEGNLTRDEVVNTRFTILFREYGEDVDGALVDERYRSYLEEGNQLIDGAFELITSLHQHYDLYIVSNGVSKTQHRRLQNSGLRPFFKEIFVSEDTGYQKPMKEFFDYVFARIPSFSVEQGLIIGDSLSADIKGGHLAGLDTCWFNPHKKLNTTNITPTYEIQELAKLYHILNIQR